jgi:hypothetical protein
MAFGTQVQADSRPAYVRNPTVTPPTAMTDEQKKAVIELAQKEDLSWDQAERKYRLAFNMPHDGNVWEPKTFSSGKGSRGPDYTDPVPYDHGYDPTPPPSPLAPPIQSRVDAGPSPRQYSRPSPAQFCYLSDEDRALALATLEAEASYLRREQDRRTGLYR